MNRKVLSQTKSCPYTFRKPTVQDGSEIWGLVKSTGVLDVNTPYAYLMLGKYFADTCVVAEEKDQIIGFVSAFLPPGSSETVFVWQVAVHHEHRGKGIGGRLLNELLKRKTCENVRYLEATVSPSNIPSQKLFHGLAQRLNCPCVISEGFTEEMFPESGHEAEPTYVIGPFKLHR